MSEENIETTAETQGAEGPEGAIAVPPAEGVDTGGEGQDAGAGAIAEPPKDAGQDAGQGEGEDEAVDYDKMTDDEYLGKVNIAEGHEWNRDVMKEFVPLLRESKISPEVFAKFVEKDSELAKRFAEAKDAEMQKQKAEAQAAFKKAGEDFRKEFTPEQVKEMNETMAALKDDQTFVTLVARSPLANNKTMGRMLLAYRQVYGEDALPGGGSADGGKKGFAEIWTGKKA